MRTSLPFVASRAAALCGLLLGLLSATVSATPVQYDESVSGDLASDPTSAFPFDIGANTITGNTYFVVSGPGCPHFCSDFDGFAFVPPERARLVDVSLSFTLTADNVSRAEAVYQLCAGLGDEASCRASLLGEQTVSFLDASPVVVDFGAAIPLAQAGTYTVRTDSLGIRALDPTDLEVGWSADYTWTFRVESIPIPGTLPLMIAALLALVPHRRRREPATPMGAIAAVCAEAGG